MDWARHLDDVTSVKLGADTVALAGRTPIERDDLYALRGLPNVLTLLGLGSAIVWLMGGSWIFAVASIVIDELDGEIARQTGDTSVWGADLDHTVDLVLTGAAAMRLGPAGLAALIPIVLIQSSTRSDKVSFGSWRAVLMGVSVVAGTGPGTLRA